MGKPKQIPLPLPVDENDSSTRCQLCGRAFNTRAALELHFEECPTLPLEFITRHQDDDAEQIKKEWGFK